MHLAVENMIKLWFWYCIW